MNSRLTAFTVVLLAFLAGALPASGADFGRTEGTFNVSARGAATYSVPIWVPPGPRGMQPSISLDYNSNTDRGIAGVGWELSAVGSIERCRRTRGQDGDFYAVLLTTADKFCLNGTRLSLVTGTYGTANSTYQTEIANHSLVTAVGTLGIGPQSFEVKGKDGLIYEYGNTADSRIIPGSGSVVYRWMLSKVRDRSGNNYKITYKPSEAPGGHLVGFGLPATIEWTPISSGSTTYLHKAEFVYDVDANKSSFFGLVAMQALVNKYRLKEIKIWANGSTLLRRYVLTHEASTSTQASLLKKIQECATTDLTNCLLETTFGYQPGQVGVTPGAATGPAGSSNGFVKGRYDFNGDGKDDLLYTSGTTYHVALSANTGFSSAYNTGISVGSGYGILVDQFLPVGRDAIATSVAGVLWIYRWDDATSAFVGHNTGISKSIDISYDFTADYDGDGLADLVTNSSNSLTVRRNISTGSGNPTFSSTTSSTASLTSYGASARYAYVKNYFGNGLRKADLNGDGKQEVYSAILINIYNQQGQQTGVASYNVPLQGSSTGFIVPAQPWIAGPAIDSPTIDFNSDSCTDRQAGTTIYVSACSGVAASTITAPATPLLVLDWDGDGKTDILANNGGNFGVYYSTGSGFSALQTTSISSSGTYFAFNQDGDSLEDLIKLNGTSAISYWTHTTSGSVGAYATNIPDLMTTITDGFGLITDIKYASTGQGNYTPGAATGYWYQEADPQTVVALVTHPDGIGTTYTKGYQYSGARHNRDRDEYAGFETMSELDSRNQTTLKTTFERYFPHTGAVLKQELFQQGGLPISKTEILYAGVALDANQFNYRVFTHPSKVTTWRYEVGGTKNGEPLTTSVTDYTSIDAVAGNVRNIKTTITDSDSTAPISPTNSYSWSTETALQFSPDTSPANWCLGIPTISTTTQSSTVPGSTSVIRRTDNTAIDYAKCRISTSVIEPNSATYKLTIAHEYDDDLAVADPDFGNITKTTITGVNVTPARVTTAKWTETGKLTGQFPLLVKNALNQETRYDYDFARGTLRSTVDPNDLETLDFYDAFGRLTSEVRPDGTATRVRMDNCTVLSNCSDFIRGAIYTEEVEADAATATTVSVMTIDRFGRTYQLRTRTPNSSPAEFSVVDTRYDEFGRVKRQSLPCLSDNCATQYWTEVTFDLLGRQTLIRRRISEVDAGNHDTRISYLGRTAKLTDALGRESLVVTDPTGRRRQLRDPNNFGMNFDYDAAGSLKGVVEMNGTTPGATLLSNVAYAYGIGAFQTAVTDADMGGITRSYNAFGELTTWSDAKGQQFSATYDELSRPLTRTEPDLTTEWTWGKASDNTISAKYVGQLKQVLTKSASGVETYKEIYLFDAKSRLSRETIVIPTETSYSYDYSYSNATGLLDTIEYPVTVGTRLKLQYAYSAGFLRSVTQFGSTTPLWQADALNERLQLKSQSLGNGLTSLQVFDAVTGALRSTKTGPGVQTTVQNNGVSYDAIGNVTQRQQNSLFLTEDFAYDNLSRLTSSSVTANNTVFPGRSFTYEPNGNIDSSSLGGSSSDYQYTGSQTGCTYQPHAQPHAVRKVGTTVYCYDGNGNMTKRGGHDITWMSFNYPLKINGANSESAEFVYGPDRQRWKMTYKRGAYTETTLYLGAQLEKVTAGSTTIWRHTVAAHGIPVALITRTSSGVDTVRYIFTDHLGSVDAIATNGTSGAPGSVERRESFTAFGDRRSALDWVSPLTQTERDALDAITREGYTYQTVLGLLGLTHMNGRVQDSQMGRFISADPFITEPDNTQNYNRYSYVYSNPLTFSDPSGFETVRVEHLYCLDRTAGGGTGRLESGPMWAPTGESDFGQPIDRPNAADSYSPYERYFRACAVIAYEIDVPVAAEPKCFEPANGGDSYIGSYAGRVGNLAAHLADSVTLGVEAGPTITLSASVFSVKPEITAGLFSLSASTTLAGNAKIAVKSPKPGNLTYSEVSVSAGSLKYGYSSGSVTEGTSTRTGPFVKTEEGFVGKAKATAWKNEFGRVNAHIVVGIGAKVEVDLARALDAVGCALSMRR